MISPQNDNKSEEPKTAHWYRRWYRGEDGIMDWKWACTNCGNWQSEIGKTTVYPNCKCKMVGVVCW